MKTGSANLYSRERVCVLFIGTQFSILYTSMYSPAEAATPVLFIGTRYSNLYTAVDTPAEAARLNNNSLSLSFEESYDLLTPPCDYGFSKLDMQPGLGGAKQGLLKMELPICSLCLVPTGTVAGQASTSSKRRFSSCCLAKLLRRRFSSVSRRTVSMTSDDMASRHPIPD